MTQVKRPFRTRVSLRPGPAQAAAPTRRARASRLAALDVASLAVLLTVLSAGVAGAQASAAGDDLRPSFEISSGPGPFRVEIDGTPHAVFELHLTNFAARPLHVVQVVTRAPSGRILSELAGPDLAQALSTPGDDTAAGLEPGGRAVLYVWREARDADIDGELSHEVRYREGDSEVERLVIRTTRGAPPLVPSLGPPLRGGPWAAVYLPHAERGHRRVFYALDGRARIPGRFAIDFFRVDVQGRGFRGDPDITRSWIGVGEPVLAVADGRVVQARPDVPQVERLSDALPYRLTYDNAAGNTVVLDLGEGRYAFYEHLAPGSLQVREGDLVRRGQVIAAVGLTGQGDRPHLHFHIADSPAHLGAEGLPFRLEDARTIGIYRSDEDVFERPWAPDDPGRSARVRGLPRPGAVLRFPE